MKISARVQNEQGQHQVTLSTDSNIHPLSVPPKQSGFGSSVNGGELLFLALATCYCNDIYREAAKRGITVQSVEVQVDGDFGAEGMPATNVRYRAKIAAQANDEAIRELAEATDRVAEIQNTLRVSTPVTLDQIKCISA